MRAQAHWLRGAPAVARPADGTVLFLAQVTVYVLLLALAALTQSGLLKALANVVAVVIFALVAFAWMTRDHPPSRWATAVAVCWLVTMTGIACSLVVNREAILWGDLVKLTIAPGFLIFGAAFERARGAAAPLWQRGSVKLLVLLLVVVPLATWGAQWAQGTLALEGGTDTSIFANRNNAAVYAVTLLAMVNVLREQPLRSTLLFGAVGLMFGTLGVLLAVLVSLLVNVGRLRELLALLVLLGLGVAAYLQAPTWGPFARVTPLLDSLRLLLDGRVNLNSVTFGELVLMLHTTDLSFLFRLKHWADLWHQFAVGDIYHQLFGFGIGSSVRLSEMGLVPHNDYLRVLFEFGAVTLTGFVAMLLLILARCGRRWETVPLLAVVIYLGSENLITNFVAIAFFYFAAGALAERIAANRVSRR